MLSEPLPPCPSCGGGARPGYRLGHNPGDYPYCGECHFSVAPDAWRRLADAVALAAAVATIEEALRRPFYRIGLDINGAHLFTGSGWRNTRGGSPLADAIIAITGDIPSH
jgi:hypothetical protein